VPGDLLAELVFCRLREIVSTAGQDFVLPLGAFCACKILGWRRADASAPPFQADFTLANAHPIRAGLVVGARGAKTHWLRFDGDDIGGIKPAHCIEGPL
jgi:hypothetical protein